MNDQSKRPEADITRPAPAMTADELEAMITSSGLTASGFAQVMDMDVNNLRKYRNGKKPISPRLADGFRLRFGSRDARLITIARDAVEALAELIQAYGCDARPPHAPDQRAPWERARRVVARAEKGGILNTPHQRTPPPMDTY
jgi:plasmid maintenance system antidote protein VapI